MRARKDPHEHHTHTRRLGFHRQRVAVGAAIVAEILLLTAGIVSLL